MSKAVTLQEIVNPTTNDQCLEWRRAGADGVEFCVKEAGHSGDHQSALGDQWESPEAA